MKKALLIVCAVFCSIGVSLAQFRPQPFEWDIKYRGEVHVGGAFSTNLRSSGFFNIKIETTLSRPLIETVHGVSLSNYLFVGAGLGLQYYAGECGEEALDYWVKIKEGKTSWDMVAIPLFANIKFFVPLNEELKPFTTLSLGGTIIACSSGTFFDDQTRYIEDYYTDKVGRNGTTYDHKIKGGFYCDWGVGVEYKRWSFAIGLQHQRYSQTTIETYYGYHGYDSAPEKDYFKNKAYSNSFYIKVGITF